MRFIKRLIFVIFLLVIAFLVYRVIKPTAAKQLLHDLESFSNTTIGTHFSLTGITIVTSWTVLAVTGEVIENTWTLSSGDDTLLLNDASLSQENFDTWIQETWTTSSTTTITPPTTPTKTTTTKKTTTTSSNGLSTQDMRDLKNLLQNFGN